MPDETSKPAPASPSGAAHHISEAQRLLEGLRRELGTHPELENAIEELELALNALTIKTAGLL